MLNRNTRQQLTDPSFYKRVNLDTRTKQRTVYMFDSLGNYNRFIDETEARSMADGNGNARRVFLDMQRSDYITSQAGNNRWYGTTDANLITRDIQGFLFNQELDGYLATLRNQTLNVDIVDLDQQKTIKFTEQEIGVFSFDLASLGLIKVYEFYSPLLKKIVAGNFARSTPNPKDKKNPFFYHIFTPAIAEHTVEYIPSKGGFFSKVLGRSVSKTELIEVSADKFIFPKRDEIAKHDIERSHKEDKNGKPMFSTTWKKCFVYIPKVEKPLPRIDLVISASFGGSRDATSELIYSCMSAIAIAERLSRAGIEYRIVACYPLSVNGVGTNSNNLTEETYPFVVIKKEGEALDRNKVAVLLSDGRQFRYQQFRGFTAQQYDAGWDSGINTSALGRIIDDSFMVIKVDGGKFAITDIKSARNSIGELTIYRNMTFDSEKEALDYAKSGIGGNLTLNRVKDAYIDYLAQSSDPSDVKASQNRDSKIVFSGALSMTEAVNQYDSVIKQITRV